MTRRWAPQTCYTLWRNTASIRKDLIYLITLISTNFFVLKCQCYFYDNNLNNCFVKIKCMRNPQVQDSYYCSVRKGQLMQKNKDQIKIIPTRQNVVKLNIDIKLTKWQMRRSNDEWYILSHVGTTPIFTNNNILFQRNL